VKIPISLRSKYLFKVPVEAQCVTPDAFAGKNLKEVAELKLWEGNRQRSLGELFDVEGEGAAKPEDVIIQIFGDVHEVKRIGEGMSAGEIVIHADTGLHTGEEMKGGKISVGGNAGSWTGAMMKNGTIEIKGNAGDYMGAAYRGSVKGMSGGTIIIHGNAGNELGCFMRKGLIKVYGSVGQFAGMHMKNGTILVLGNSQGRDGAEMTGGKIVIGGGVPSILPTFTFDGIKQKVKTNGEDVAGPFYLFVGDQTEQGDGKLYVSKASNNHLKFYERYL
jgi:formylmethanofuran dehydrogenase subunit C